MLFFRRVSGSSMLPALKHGDVIMGWNSKPAKGDIVVARWGEIEIIKRVTNIENGRFFLEGDNPSASTDSREFGFVDENVILGVMKLRLPHAQDAPRPRNKNAVIVGWIAASIMALFAVIHLFRIDTFVPELDGVLPGGRELAGWAAVLIVIAEVFAIPFLLRMKLSSLARIVSAIFSVMVPLTWLLVAVWGLGQTYSTAQLGEFVSLPSTWLLVVLNLLWLALGLYAVYLLQPSWSKELRKY